ncbi:MAG TPA: hypothetical protein VFU84_04635, partial [Gaiellaceae bacterium]|nr:hypothetical protein [Gaiellaceae bacterium]
MREGELHGRLLVEPRQVRGLRRAGRGESERNCRERGGDQRRGPNDQSLLPTKFTGVTSTIAMACA